MIGSGSAEGRSREGTPKAFEADVVVVGSGIAGLTFALRMARGASVLLLTKKHRAESNTNWARGGIAAVVGADDDAALHVADTLVAGAGLCHGDVVARIVAEGPARIGDLAAWGTGFHREGDAFSLGREGGHSRRRIVHAGDRTGRAIETALLDRASARGLAILEDHRVVDLEVREGEAGPVVCGVRVVDDAGGEERTVHARAVFLATGGCGRVYRHTTNPAIATGDGVAMAFRAGARIANMEFIQFHPTALHPTEDPAFLISEALRGEGAVLRRRDGSAFMDRHHPLGSLAPRDVVARAIAGELAASGDDHVVLDVTGIPAALRADRFASTLDGCRSRGVDPERDGVPVVPAAHYVCGGIWTDSVGRTSLDGLMAAGEVAFTGLHGANRLASNSLLEAVVMAHRAALDLADVFRGEGRWSDAPVPPTGVAASVEVAAGPVEASETPPPDGAAPDPAAPAAMLNSAEREAEPEIAELRRLMWEKAGIVRTVAGLEEAREALMPAARAGATPELRNLATAGRLIVECALRRRESRGLHWLTDFPWRDNERCLADTTLTIDQVER